MRRGVWVVLVLMGGVPAGAMAQQEREPPAEQARAPRQISDEAFQQQIAELWQAVHQLQGEVAQLREQAGGRAQAPAVGGSGRTEGTAEGSAQPGSTWSKPGQPGPAAGGSGMGPRSQGQAGRPDEQIFVGTVRSVTSDRLIMVDPSDRVYEFGLGAQTRIIGPEGYSSSLQALEEGSLVRAVTREAEGRNEVRSLQILGPARAP